MAVVIRTMCFCDERVAAQGRTFVWDGAQAAWYFPGDPVRTATNAAVYNAEADHRGEPYGWFTCPWCGHPLPGAQFPNDPVPNIDDADLP